MKDPGFWNDGYFWRWPMYVAVWGGATLAVIAVLIFILGFAYPRWWEDHKTERGRGDAPVTGIVQDGSEGDEIIAIEMPDDFSNFVTRCVWEGYRGFTTSNDGGAFVIPDPECEMPTITDPEDVTP